MNINKTSKLSVSKNKFMELIIFDISKNEFMELILFFNVSKQVYGTRNFF